MDETLACCDICKQQPRLYKCPRCSTYTCSLQCSKEHKVKMECNGIRDRAAFVANKNLSNDTIKNDFHFLEDVLQTKDRAKRILVQNCGGTKQLHNRNEDNRNSKKKATVNLADEIPIILTETYQRLDTYSKGVKNLFTAAKARGIKLVLMPNGMTKRTLNKSLFVAKENTIYWKVFVVFIVNSTYKTESLFRVDLESTKPTDKFSFAQEALLGVSVEGISEHKTLLDILDQFLVPTTDNAAHRHALRTIRMHKSDVCCLMHKIPSPSNNPLFIEASMHSSLKDVLQGQTLIEYPTLYFGTMEHMKELRKLISSTTNDCSGNDADSNDTSHSSGSDANCSYKRNNDSSSSQANISATESNIANEVRDNIENNTGMNTNETNDGDGEVVVDEQQQQEKEKELYNNYYHSNNSNSNYASNMCEESTALIEKDCNSSTAMDTDYDYCDIDNNCISDITITTVTRVNNVLPSGGEESRKQRSDATTAATALMIENSDDDDESGSAASALFHILGNSNRSSNNNIDDSDSMKNKADLLKNAVADYIAAAELHLARSAKNSNSGDILDHTDNKINSDSSMSIPLSNRSNSTSKVTVIDDDEVLIDGHDDDEDEDEFLSQLKDFANTDIETLKAIIAAEEAAAEAEET